MLSSSSRIAVYFSLGLWKSTILRRARRRSLSATRVMPFFEYSQSKTSISIRYSNNSSKKHPPVIFASTRAKPELYSPEYSSSTNPDELEGLFEGCPGHYRHTSSSSWQTRNPPLPLVVLRSNCRLLDRGIVLLSSPSNDCQFRKKIETRVFFIAPYVFIRYPHPPTRHSLNFHSVISDKDLPPVVLG
jgi:hypothetical protein